MSLNTSFHSILEQKLRTHSVQSSPSHSFANSSSQSAVDQDPAHLAFLLGTLHKSSTSRPVTKLYPTKPRPPAPPPPPHSLTEAQSVAFAFLIENGAELAPAFTQKDLRTAFRRTALRLHPDMNKGTNGPFIELKKHYAELSQLFSSAE